MKHIYTQLTDIQKRILRDKQKRNFNNREYTLRFDWDGKEVFYTDYSEHDINEALYGLVDLGLTDVIRSGYSIELNLTDAGVKLASLMLS